ncbi:MAG: hypothetical protein JWQ40_4988 [Segetibacter sp.]|nr:hypothetical protein [Segetibacter sp.]
MKNIHPTAITDPIDKLSATEQNSFFGVIQPVMLEKNDKAFRFCMHQGYPMSDFWFLKNSYDELFSIYHSELRFSPGMTNESARQRFSRILQNHAAVLHQFPGSSRDYMIVNFTVKVTFKTDVIGYVGATKTQQTFMPVSEYDIQTYNKPTSPIHLKKGDERIKERKQGGLQQLVIPRFKSYLDKRDLQIFESLVETVVVPF